MEKAYYVEQPNVQLDIDGLEFFLQISPGNILATRPHIHNAVEFLYITKGRYTVYLNDKSHFLLPGDLILFNSNTVHYAVTGSDAENSYYVIKVNPTLLLALTPRGEDAQNIKRFVLNRPEYSYLWKKEELLNNKRILSVLDAMIDEYFRGDYGRELSLKLKSVELLLQILKADPPQQMARLESEVTRQICEIMAYVGQHFAEDIDEKQLSLDFGMSYSYFSRSFHWVSGMSFRKYLNKIRIDHAEQLLFTTKKSVTEIAFLCGYNTTSYFISVYRSMKGHTPYQARVKKTGFF